MTGMSRRAFGRVAAAGMLGSVGLSDGCTTRGTDHATSAGPPPPSGKGVGFVLSHEQFRTDRLVAQAQAAEEAGFHHVWASDHIQPWQDNQGHSMFPWLTLALVGSATSRISFGTGVTCPTYRYHPATVAQAFASLAILNPGRVFLGVGTGERLNEQATTNAYGDYAERHDRLVEAIDLIRRLWSGSRISFSGRYFQTNSLKLYDVPAAPPPIFVAAGGPKSAKLAGQHGDGWISQAHDVMDPKLLAAFGSGAQAAGRDVATLGKRAELFAVVGGNAEAARAATLWRFTAGAVDQPNPVEIQRAAESNPVDKVLAGWTVGADAARTSAPCSGCSTPGPSPSCTFPKTTPSPPSTSTAPMSCRSCAERTWGTRRFEAVSKPGPGYPHPTSRDSPIGRQSMDAITFLRQDHKSVLGLLETLDGAPSGPGAQASGLETMVNNLIIAESQHEAIEEQFFWPAVRDAMGDGLVDKAIEQEQAGKKLLQRLEDGKPGEPDYHEALQEFVAAGRDHIAYEQNEVWPQVETVLSREELEKIGEKLEAAKKIAPTRPHPDTPPNPAVLKTMGMGAAIVDHVRDAVTGRGKDNPPDPQMH
ncbi:F420-dependent oxidoreductase, G6PDH family protein [Mycobacterium intracellulare]|nr:F420-dependent oxidoreductase, G6PDH family protein [Mycobacterium intracellulare]